MSIEVNKIETISEVQQLYEIVYPLNDADKIKWLYGNNPRGTADIFAAYDTVQSKIVGVLAIIPMLSNINGTQMLIGQAIDGMVHPEYRGRRIFDLLIEEMFGNVKGRYQLLIGFPNHLSRGRLIKMGWRRFGELITWSFPLNSRAVLGSLANKPIIGSVAEMFANVPIKTYARYYLKKTNQANSKIIELKDSQIKIDKIESQITKINSMMLVRDPEFMCWRLQSLPANNYRTFAYYKNDELLGYFCYKPVKQSAEVVDFVISPEPENIEGALSLLIKHCQQEQYHGLHFQLSKYAYCYSSLKRCGFIKRPSDQVIIIYPTDSKISLPNYEDCYMNLADTDWV